MGNSTENLNLYLTDMDTDGNDTFDFDRDLNQNFMKIDNAIGNMKNTVVGLPPSICTNLRITKNGLVVSLKWNDPNDTVIDGLVACSWGKTVIVRKAGSYPESIEDGTIIATNTERNKYSTSELTDNLPDSANDYYYRAFPISANGAICLDNANKFGSAIIYEFIINPSNGNPFGKIEYCGRNANYKPAKMDFANGVFDYGDWKNSFIMDAFKPVMLKQTGEVAYYLNPYNMKQKLDGTASDATNKNFAGNVMIQVAQIWIKEVNENGLTHIYIANQQVDEDYDCLSHINKSNRLVPYYYYAKYNGSTVNGVQRSISGLAPSTNASGVTQRTYCQANGNGHDAREASFLRLMYYLHMLIGRTTNVQETFGTGRYTGGSNNNYAQLTSGLNDDKGMFHGDNNNGTVTTFFIDNFWGNVWELTVGCIQKNGKLLYKMTPNTYDGSTANDYNTDGTGYLDSGVNVGTGTISQTYIKNMQCVPKIGLVPCEFTGASATTYYCDGFWTTNVVGYLRSGGGSNSGDGLLYGLFAFAVDSVASSSGWLSGASLSYKNPS